MKYTLEVTINLPRTEVIEKLNNENNLRHWQEGLLEVKHISGVSGEEGATTKLSYINGTRKTEIVKTITKQNFPDEYHGTYVANNVVNKQRNYFKSTLDGKTKWISESEFTFSNFGMKLLGFLFPGMFKKQSMKYLNNFKAFAEEGISVNNE